LGLVHGEFTIRVSANIPSSASNRFNDGWWAEDNGHNPTILSFQLITIASSGDMMMQRGIRGSVLAGKPKADELAVAAARKSQTLSAAMSHAVRTVDAATQSHP
jgi:hypothetical protein